jgi:hypothetical protein
LYNAHILHALEMCCYYAQQAAPDRGAGVAYIPWRALCPGGCRP